MTDMNELKSLAVRPDGLRFSAYYDPTGVTNIDVVVNYDDFRPADYNAIIRGLADAAGRPNTPVYSAPTNGTTGTQALPVFDDRRYGTNAAAGDPF